VARIKRQTDSLQLLRELPLDSIDYDLLLSFGQSYQLYAVKPGYYSVSDTLNLRPAKSYRILRRDLYLEPIEAGSTITLNRVYFQRASPELLPESFAELGQLYETMHQNPGLEIEIRGHTDNLGEEAVLQALSEARAARVRRYLLERGIHPARVSSQGFGSTQPVASNEDPATRPLNRRVEFRVIKL
jgi:outer membrane protein OmpA-like peptidoglycan-associated protein